jgi:hypothetical protein
LLSPCLQQITEKKKMQLHSSVVAFFASNKNKKMKEKTMVSFSFQAKEKKRKHREKKCRGGS